MSSPQRIKLSDFKNSRISESARIKTTSKNTPSDIGGKKVISCEEYKEAMSKASEKGAQRNSKFNAKKTVVDGITFDSVWESKRYSQLKIMEKSGEIEDLQLQVPFALEVNGIKVCDYKADFVYKENGHQIVEDAKGVKTPEYKLKKKLMKAVLGIDIKETFRTPKKSR